MGNQTYVNKEKGDFTGEFDLSELEMRKINGKVPWNWVPDKNAVGYGELPEGADPRWGYRTNVVTVSRMSFPVLSEDGLTYTSTMPVGPFVAQLSGRLAGGALLMFAETTSGMASLLQLPDEWQAVGQNIQACHVHGAKMGSTVTATGHLEHRGRRTHVWSVRVTDEANRLISVIAVTNAIVHRVPLT